MNASVEKQKRVNAALTGFSHVACLVVKSTA